MFLNLVTAAFAVYGKWRFPVKSIVEKFTFGGDVPAASLTVAINLDFPVA
jgi:hypothetical protein